MSPERSPSSPVLETRVRARSYELDSFGHVNHAVFFNYFEHARWEILRTGGFPAAELSRRGWSIVLAHAEADFRRPVLQDDELLIRTRVVVARRTALRIRHEILRGGDGGERREKDVVAAGEVVAVWLDGNDRPMPIPPEVRRAFGLEARDRGSRAARGGG